MTIDLTQFHDAFFEESFEALDSMEAALLKLDIGAPDKELINTIFRVAHSIKGGSATFGFSDIASFTHSLETLLDELRSGAMQVTMPMSDLLLKSVDVMRAMLRAVQQKKPIDTQRVSDLQFDLELMIAQKRRAPLRPAAHCAGTAGSTASAVASQRQSAGKSCSGHIPELFARGNDPMRMLRELAELGELESLADISALPPVRRTGPAVLLRGMELELAGDVEESAIRQVFEWAEGDCELQITLAGAPAAAPFKPPRCATPQPPRPPAAPSGSDANLAATAAAPPPVALRRGPPSGPVRNRRAPAELEVAPKTDAPGHKTATPARSASASRKSTSS